MVGYGEGARAGAKGERATLAQIDVVRPKMRGPAKTTVTPRLTSGVDSDRAELRQSIEADLYHVRVTR